MSTFQPIHFIPKARKPEILSHPITQIIAAPHTQQSGTNHWCFYLVTSPTTSVQLDCQPSYSAPSQILSGGSRAFLVFSELETSIAASDAKPLFRLDFRSGLTVNDVYEVLVRNGRHKYEFDSKGVGCRFWVTGQVELFLKEEVVVDEGQVEDVKGAVRKLWPEETALALDQGAYYE